MNIHRRHFIGMIGSAACASCLYPRFAFAGYPVSNQDITQESEDLRKIVLLLNTGGNNPRNSEGDFITLKNGRILFIYSHYTGGSSSDFAPAYLAGRFSDDGGKTK